MAGAGAQSAGDSSAGTGSPDSPTSYGGRILRDSTTGLTVDARAIDPVARDFVMDANGRLLGMGGVRQMVVLAVSTELESSAQREVGRDFRSIDRMTNDFEQRVDRRLRAALQRLVDAGLIQIQRIVTVRLGTGKSFTRLYWRDLTTSTDNVDAFN